VTALAEGRRAAREGAALFDAAAWGRVLLRGPDRRTFLHGLLTSDVKGLRPLSGQPSCLLTHKGKLVADFSLYDLGEEFLAVGAPGLADRLAAGLAKYLPLSDTTLEDAAASRGAVCLWGPTAAEVARKVWGTAPDGAGVLTVARPGGESWLAGWPALRPASVLAVFPASEAAALRAELAAAGAVPAEAAAWDAVRIEAGIPLFGADVDGETYPAEAGLDGAVSYTKGCYLGQETTTRIKTQGKLPRRLAVLRVSGTAAAGAEVRAGGEPVGRVTSAAAVLEDGRSWAMAALKRESAEPGTALVVTAAGAGLPAEVAGPAPS
jgi:folate-binding protein YgfZ